MAFPCPVTCPSPTIAPSSSNRARASVTAASGGGSFRFDACFDLSLPEAELRSQLVVTLLAVLELARLKVVRVLQSPDGEMHDVGGVYREVVPNRKLVYTWAWKTTPERESLVTIALRAVDGVTELTLTHAQFFDADARDRHNKGWQGTLARLDKFLA